MAANSTSAFARTSANLASSVLSALVPTTSSAKSTFPPNYRPSKVELEARLSHAHVRARNRRLRQSLVGQAPPPAIPQRTPRAVAVSVPVARHIPEPTTFYSTPSTPAFHMPIRTPILAPSPLSAPETPAWRKIVTAPSPSALPTPPDTPAFARPRFPHRRSRSSPVGRASDHGLKLNIVAEDTILVPTHIRFDSFRRTPGAPRSSSKTETGHGGSYFHLPSNLLTPALPPVPAATTGLGIMNVAFGGEGGADQYFPAM